MKTMKKKKFAKHARRSPRFGALVFLALIICVAGGAAFLSTFDLNAYREKIADSATQSLGRKVTLAGPLAFSLTFERGLTLSASDVSLANPSWASRPMMAHIGRVFVHVDWLKLLGKKLDIVAFELEKADILLETGANGANNWTFAKAESAKAEPAAQASSGGSPVAINVREAAITDSRFGTLGADGKLTIFDVPHLTIHEKGQGIVLSFKGTIAGQATTVELEGGSLAEITGARWPFNLEAVYGPIAVAARGTLLDGVKKVVLDQMAVKAGSSDMEGALVISLAGSRPAISGSLKGKKVDPADFSMGDGTESAAPMARKGGSDRIFTRDPLPLDGLKAADVDLTVTIDELKAGVMPLRTVVVPVKLAGGKLNVAPFSATLGGHRAEGKLGLDASGGQPQLTFAFDAKDMDMGQLLSLWGMEAVITGKADLDARLTASGRSTYDMASTANGGVNILMDGGQVSSSAAKSLAAGVLDLFVMPGAGGLTNPGVNCVAGRYVITNGLVQTKGLLIDTDVTTISGQGTVNLPDEHISMNFYTRPHALGLTAALPPMKVYGNLKGPSFTLDAGAVAEKVVGLLTNSATGSTVPTVLSVPKGQNACAATLDNPAAAKAAEEAGDKKTLLPSTGSLQDKVKGVGSKLLRGLGSSLLGQ